MGIDDCSRDAAIQEALLNSCSCKPTERSLCYVEGTQLDKSMSLNLSEYSENVWFDVKPPKFFTKQNTPLVSSRQVDIARVLLNGRLKGSDEKPQETLQRRKKEARSSISINKKKSVVKFLGEVNLDE